MFRWLARRRKKRQMARAMQMYFEHGGRYTIQYCYEAQLGKR